MNYNPKNSETNKIDIQVSFDLVYKSQGPSPTLLDVYTHQQQNQGLQASNSAHIKIQQVIEKADIKEGFGLNTKILKSHWLELLPLFGPLSPKGSMHEI